LQLGFGESDVWFRLLFSDRLVKVEFKSLPTQRTTISAGSDPRTSTTLLLFEEFVPFEYRQQLAEGQTSRRRFPSLFSASSKSKQWKPAQTLNGRPYVVGLVPHNPSYREVEFEGLLRQAGDTKVISLGAKTARHPSVFTTSGDAMDRVSRIMKHGNLPPIVTKTSKPPNEEPPPVPPPHADSTPSKKASRFRLPGGIPVPSPGGVRKAGRAPAEYSTVDFETRLASYSDEDYEPEGGGGGGGGGKRKATEAEKQARRESKDDGWMEILVGTQDRRIGGQEAEFKKGKGRMDPESAGMEVAQALAGIGATPFSDDEGEYRDHGVGARDDSIVDEVQLVPRRMAMYDFAGQLDLEGSQAQEYDDEPEGETIPDEELDRHYDDEHQHADEGEGEEEEEDVREGDQDHVTSTSGLSYRQQQKAQRRLGYFDLHPERRPVSAQDEDPRRRLEEESDEEEVDDEAIYGSPEQGHYVAPLVPRKPSGHRPSVGVHDVSSPGIEGTDLGNAEDRRSDWENVRPAAKVDKGKRPERGDGDGNGAGNPSTPSKTAALIEMYRKRERGAGSSPNSPATPSRLPIRALPATPRDVANMASSSPAVVPLPPIPTEVPRVVELPAPVDRYVHGAPLHRVLEEEEAASINLSL
jgi:hypothetical protein